MILTSNQADPRELVAYTYADAARLLDIPASTIRAWKKGQAYSHPSGERRWFVQPLPAKRPQGLSYFDLVEIYVLRSLRTNHGYSLRYIRQAMEQAQEEFGIQRLFLHEEFRHDGKRFFLDRWDHLVTLSPSRQLAFREVLDRYLKRIEYDREGWVFELFPPVREKGGVEGPKVIAVNATISFGRPIIKRTGTRTAAVASRLDAGEDPKHIIADFGLTEEEFDQALLVEAA